MRRWADMRSDDESEEGSQRFLTRQDDVSYQGAPSSEVEDSRRGLNARMKHVARPQLKRVNSDAPLKIEGTGTANSSPHRPESQSQSQRCKPDDASMGVNGNRCGTRNEPSPSQDDASMGVNSRSCKLSQEDASMGLGNSRQRDDRTAANNGSCSSEKQIHQVVAKPSGSAQEADVGATSSSTALPPTSSGVVVHQAAAAPAGTSASSSSSSNKHQATSSGESAGVSGAPATTATKTRGLPSSSTSASSSATDFSALYERQKEEQAEANGLTATSAIPGRKTSGDGEASSAFPMKRMPMKRPRASSIKQTPGSSPNENGTTKEQGQGATGGGRLSISEAAGASSCSAASSDARAAAPAALIGTSGAGGSTSSTANRAKRKSKQGAPEAGSVPSSSSSVAGASTKGSGKWYGKGYKGKGGRWMNGKGHKGGLFGGKHGSNYPTSSWTMLDADNPSQFGQQFLQQNGTPGAPGSQQCWVMTTAGGYQMLAPADQAQQIQAQQSFMTPVMTSRSTVSSVCSSDMLFAANSITAGAGATSGAVTPALSVIDDVTGGMIGELQSSCTAVEKNINRITTSATNGVPQEGLEHPGQNQQQEQNGMMMTGSSTASSSNAPAWTTRSGLRGGGAPTNDGEAHAQLNLSPDCTIDGLGPDGVIPPTRTSSLVSGSGRVFLPKNAASVLTNMQKDSMSGGVAFVIDGKTFVAPPGFDFSELQNGAPIIMDDEDEEDGDADAEMSQLMGGGAGGGVVVPSGGIMGSIGGGIAIAEAGSGGTSSEAGGAASSSTSSCSTSMDVTPGAASVGVAGGAIQPPRQRPPRVDLLDRLTPPTSGDQVVAHHHDHLQAPGPHKEHISLNPGCATTSSSSSTVTPRQSVQLCQFPVGTMDHSKLLGHLESNAARDRDDVSTEQVELSTEQAELEDQDDNDQGVAPGGASSSANEDTSDHDKKTDVGAKMDDVVVVPPPEVVHEIGLHLPGLPQRKNGTDGTMSRTNSMRIEEISLTSPTRAPPASDFTAEELAARIMNPPGSSSSGTASSSSTSGGTTSSVPVVQPFPPLSNNGPTATPVFNFNTMSAGMGMLSSTTATAPGPTSSTTMPVVMYNPATGTSIVNQVAVPAASPILNLGQCRGPLEQLHPAFSKRLRAGTSTTTAEVESLILEKGPRKRKKVSHGNTRHGRENLRNRAPRVDGSDPAAAETRVQTRNAQIKHFKDTRIYVRLTELSAMDTTGRPETPKVSVTDPRRHWKAQYENWRKAAVDFVVERDPEYKHANEEEDMPSVADEPDE